MSKKLLNKTTGDFLLYAVVVLLVAAPLFYAIVQKLYIDETDETLVLHKDEFETYFEGTFTGHDIATWNKYNRNVKIIPYTGIVRDTLINTVYFDALEEENEPYRELWGPVTIRGKKFTYVEKTNLIEREDMVFSIAGLFSLVIVLLLAGGTVIGNISSSRRWRPFYDTLAKIRDFEIDKNRQPDFGSTGIAEFDSLNTSISRLIEKNTEIYRNQREFIDNAAHELQTPLALFRTKIETLSQSQGLDEEQLALIDSLQQDVARFNRLNRNLLLLSRIEHGAMPEKQPVVVNGYILKVLDFFTEQAMSRHISVRTDLTPALRIDADPGMVEVLVNNLFLNAIRHNRQDGTVSVAITGHTLRFANTGKDEALDSHRLFERFSKTDHASTGNGLGLAIVRKIADLNGWTIAYRFEQGLHIFEIDFKIQN
jgi:signal transduction histidine kinase